MIESNYNNELSSQRKYKGMFKSIIFVILFCSGLTVSIANEVKDWGGLEIHIYEVDLTKVPDGVFDFAGEEYLYNRIWALLILHKWYSNVKV